MALTLDLFVEVAYALGCGVLVGLERSMGSIPVSERFTLTPPAPGAATPDPPPPPPSEDGLPASSRTPDTVANEQEFLGIRTFAVLSLVGYGAALAADKIPMAGAVLLGGIALLVLAMYVKTTELMGAGITTEAAALGTAGLGALCHHHPQVAGVLAVLLTVLLASKRFTRDTIRRMRRVELTDTLKLLVVVLIVLPMLPNRPLDPWGALNPYKIGFLVVLISGIGFVGYFLTRILGAQKGIGLTGIVGGLTSSTAVTAAMAQQAKESPNLRAICAFSTVAANATMFCRVLVVVALLDRHLARQLAYSVGAMAATAALCAIALWFSASKGKTGAPGGAERVKLKNPFSVGPALKFAVFFVGILLVAKIAKAYLGNNGLYVAAGLSGLADVDAITMSISEQTVAETLVRKVGAVAITIAVVSNSVVKSGIAISTGGWPFGRIVAAALGLATVVGLVAAFVA
jgi:uncharacterized membrane protein (DUF4010 family)